MARKHEVVVFARDNDVSAPEYYEMQEVLDSVKVHRINNTMQFPRYYEYDNIAIARRFEHLVREEKPDVVHVQHLHGLSARLLRSCQDADIPLVFSLHDYWLLCRRMSLLRPNDELCSGPAPKKCQQCRFSEIERYLIPPLIGRMMDPLPNTFFDFLAKKSSQRRLEGSAGLVDLLFVNHMARTELLQVLLEDIDIFVAHSKFVRDVFVKWGIDEEKIAVIPIGIDPAAFSNFSKSSSSKVRFGYMGTVARHKGVHVLIEAFNSLIDHPSVELQIWGQAPSNKYLQSLRALNRNPNTKFQGPYTDPSAVLSQLDVLVIPSIMYESYSLVAREALMTRTPVIAASIGALSEVVIPNKNGLLFEAGNSRDLARQIEFLGDNPSTIRDMSRRIEHVQTISEQVAQLDALYRSLV